MVGRGRGGSARGRGGRGRGASPGRGGGRGGADGGGSSRGRGRGGGGGGGGGGRGRGRNMPSVIAAMNEMGNGSASTYFAQMAEMTTRNADAARDYYPPLPDGTALKASAAKIKDQDRYFLELREQLLRVETNPHYVIDDADPAGARGKGRTERRESVWHPDSMTFHLTSLPYTVRHDEAAEERRREQRRAERAHITSLLRAKRGDGGDDDENNDEDDAEKDPNAVKNVGEDEDEMEQDADYQMGGRFDDDDGYISQDSGTNVALF